MYHFNVVVDLPFEEAKAKFLAALQAEKLGIVSATLFDFRRVCTKFSKTSIRCGFERGSIIALQRGFISKQ